MLRNYSTERHIYSSYFCCSGQFSTVTHKYLKIQTKRLFGSNVKAELESPSFDRFSDWSVHNSLCSEGRQTVSKGSVAVEIISITNLSVCLYVAQLSGSFWRHLLPTRLVPLVLQLQTSLLQNTWAQQPSGASVFMLECRTLVMEHALRLQAPFLALWININPITS